MIDGTVDAKWIVITGADDDGLDWNAGWIGRVQYLLVQQLAESGEEAEHGIEGDNLERDNLAEPVSSPTISNVTIVGRAGNPSEAIRLRRGTRGALWNTVVTGFDGACVRVTEDATEAHVIDGSLSVHNQVYECAGGPAAAGLATDLIDGATVLVGDAMLGTGWRPTPGSPALNIGAGPADAFFDPVTYAGAFDTASDWATGWTTLATE